MPALDLDILRVGVPRRPVARVDDVFPDAFAGRVDEQFVVGEQVSVGRLKARRPVDVRGAVGEIVFHRHGFVSLCMSNRVGTGQRARTSEPEDQQGGGGIPADIEHRGDATHAGSLWIRVAMAWSMPIEPLRACAP